MSTLVAGHWLPAKDGDVRAMAIFRRHYSFREYADNRPRRLFVGLDDSGQQGINCAVFRNESSAVASDLVREADEIAWNRWAGERHYTYVDAKSIASPNPGYCFKRAGWKWCGRTKSGLDILERVR